MSKILAIVLAALLGIPFSSVQFQSGDGQTVPISETNTPIVRGITVNKIPLTTVSDFSTVPQSMQNKIDEVKEQKGFYLFDNKELGINEEGYHLLVSLGEKPTAGYGVKVNAVEDNEGVTEIYVEETPPEEGAMVAQVITYPATLIKIKGVTPNVRIISKQGKFGNLNVSEKK